MQAVYLLTTWAFVAISSWAFSLDYAPSIYLRPADIVSELGPKLSPNASIILPGSADFIISTTRWQQYRSPEINVAVEVTNERDIRETVCGFLSNYCSAEFFQILYANQRGIPFLAKVSGHGAVSSLGNVHNGIEIWMRAMKDVRVSEDGKTATIGGGIKAREVTDALWAVGKQTGILILKLSLNSRSGLTRTSHPEWRLCWHGGPNARRWPRDAARPAWSYSRSTN